ncbi:hypothetical protein N7485_000144 [Penicillium canescens]|nr:hypothetical protein N7485_000144 [Penicillium canescens]
MSFPLKRPNPSVPNLSNNIPTYRKMARNLEPWQRKNMRSVGSPRSPLPGLTGTWICGKIIRHLSFGLTYVPADCGSIIPGKSKAPKAFQDVSIVSKLRDAGLPSVSEHHPLDTPATYAATTFAPGSVRNEEVNISVCQRVRRTIAQNLNSSVARPPFQVILGGDCCMSPGV